MFSSGSLPKQQWAEFLVCPVRGRHGARTAQAACGIWGQRGWMKGLDVNTSEIPKKEVSPRCQILIPVPWQ